MTNPQSFNRYAFVQNDPVNFVDPSGLDQEPLPPVIGPPPSTVTIPISFSEPITVGIFGGFFGGDPHFLPELPPVGGEDGDAGGGAPQRPEDPLPFNSCDEFVSYLVNLTTEASKNIEQLQGRWLAAWD